jgi:hypothetical protein
LCPFYECVKLNLTQPNGLPNYEHNVLKRAKEVHMERDSEKIVLTCKECGEKLILVGSEEDWRSRHAIFMCEARHKLSFEGQADEEVLAASYTNNLRFLHRSPLCH